MTRKAWLVDLCQQYQIVICYAFGSRGDEVRRWMLGEINALAPENPAVDRLGWVERMAAAIRQLPLQDREAFFADERNVWTADSCLRRVLEALLDLGRRILAKGFGVAAGEYKAIATQLHRRQVLSTAEAALLRTLAGYRNRLAHFYHEVSAEALYDICSNDLDDVTHNIANAYHRWLKAHPERLDHSL